MRSHALSLLLVCGCGSSATPSGVDAGASYDLAPIALATDLAGVPLDLASAPSTWKQESSAATFWDIWGASATDLYAVGAGPNVTGFIYHSSGGGVWTSIYNAGPLYAVWGSGPNDLYVAGMVGVTSTIIHSTDAGATWQPGTLPAINGSWVIDSLWGSGGNDIYAAGTSTDAHATITGSVILHSTGDGNWAKQYSNTSGAGFALWGADAGHVLAVARANGSVVRTSGNGVWSAYGAVGASWRIFGFAADDLYVAGANATLFHSTDAMSWTPQSLASGSSENLRALWGSASDNLFAVGDQGSIFHFDGAHWTTESVGGGMSAGGKLRALWGRGGDVFAAGDPGIYRRF